MTDPRWDRAKQVFNDALEKTGLARDKFVADSCADDPELRAQVLALLKAHDDASGFLATSAATTSAVPPEAPGTRVGPYKLLQVIGEGGFGVVYMAEQEQPLRRRVALKIIKLGMDTREVIARFEAERQALAMMDHPNIARVFDAGATESGRPYFVMELVQGVSITTYCDGNRINTRERLQLFTDTCRAVHHAHEKGLIHRDIKPSNVLVTLHDGKPVPKIIDFGVAKATNQRLTEKTLFTAYGQFVGTPAYMSPEQAEMSGLEVDRRSDIYSLGVLLYELLTGTTPFDAEALRARGFLEVLRIIREEDPPTPSARLSTLGDKLAEVAGRRDVDPAALSKLVRGDLDWIVMKALDKDRRRRYGSASELSDEVARYFRHEPVIARPPSAAYRLRKFVKRRQGRLVAAASVFGAVVMGGALAQVGGWLGSSTAAIPSRRLLYDLSGGRDARATEDGRHLLRYNIERQGFELIEIDTERTTLLTRSGGAESWFRDYHLAPDRQQIAAVRVINSDPGRAPTRDTERGSELRLYQVGDEGEGRLLSIWEQGHNVQIFGWSPDRARVWIFVIRPDQAAEIISVNVADGSRQVLRTLPWRTITQPPALSPDGRLIAYHDADGPKSPPDIFLIGTDGGGPVRVAHPASDSKPLFTPDGSGVVFQSDRKGGDLWFLPISGGRPAGEARPVWGDVGSFGQADLFAQNGSLIYFFSTNGWEIYTAEIDLDRGIIGAPEHLPRLRGEMNNAPGFSPDGKFLAHLRDRGRRLVIRELATGAEREFPIAGPQIVPWVDFCPDGRSVIVAGAESSGRAAYRVNLDRGGAERLAIPSSRAVCLGDGRDIVYLRALGQGRFEVVRRSLVTGSETRLHGGPAHELGLARSPDAGKVAFVEMRPDEARLMVMPSAGGEAVTVASSPLVSIGGRTGHEFQGFMWLPAGDALLVVRGTAGNTDAPEVTLWRVSLDGTAAPLGRMRLPAYQGGFVGSLNYTIHPTGSRIAFERHAGMVSQFWAIDNLAQFIKSGGAVAVPPDATRR